MRIGLITIFQVPNYGSVLQTYATQFMLEKMGVECNVINYRYPNEWHWKHGAKRPSGWKAMIRRLIPSRKTVVLRQFREKFLNFTPLFNNLDEMHNADWSNYDAFVVGSDQVWNAKFVLGDCVFMLSFAPECKPRYSLASSFASNSLPKQYLHIYKRELLKFTALSVREKNGVSIINEELGINKTVEVLLDPTLLLSEDEWLKAIPRSRILKRRPYILFYMWDYAFDPKPYIFEVTKFFQQKMNCDVIALEGWKNQKCTDGLVMENRSSSTVSEFIDLFANADMVITSSFHGTAFALNFGVPLVSIFPKTNGDDRQYSLLKSLDCSNCGIKIGDIITEIDPLYDIDKEQKLLNSIREKNIKWIRDNIIR